MSEVKVYVITKEAAEKTRSLFLPEIAEVPEDGLPTTALAAVKDEMTVGALAGAIKGDVFEIYSLYVEPEYRRKGVARELIWKLEELLSDSGMAIRAQFTVEDGDSGTLPPFFMSMGFTDDPLLYPSYYMGYLGDLNLEDKTGGKSDGDIVSFAEVNETLLREMSHIFAGEGAPLPENGLTSPEVDKELSFCVLHEEKIVSYATVEPIDEKTVYISSVWTAHNNPRQMLFMLFKLVGALKERYEPQTRVIMLAVNEAEYELIHHLFDYVEPVSFRMVKI